MEKAKRGVGTAKEVSESEVNKLARILKETYGIDDIHIPIAMAGENEVPGESIQLKKKYGKEILSIIRSTITTALMPIVNPKAEYYLTPFEKMDILRSGISKQGLEQLKEKTALDYDKFSKMLSTTKATLINKKGDERFNAALSEKILSVADVYSYGYEVFEDEQRFNDWMLRPNRALGGKAPYEIMDNQFGREEVRNVIGRIDYGVYS